MVRLVSQILKILEQAIRLLSERSKRVATRTAASVREKARGYEKLKVAVEARNRASGSGLSGSGGLPDDGFKRD